jgi:predicted Zn-dependent protease
MIGEKEFKAIRERVFDACRSDEVELVLGGGCENLTRFGENRITQNVSEERYELRIRVRRGRKMGLASTNDFSDASLKRSVAEAEALAEIQEESERVLDFRADGERSTDSAWDAATGQLGAGERADWVRAAVERAARDGIEVGGIALSSEGSIGDYGSIEPFAVANSTGLYRFARKSRAIFEVSAQKGDGAGRSRVLARSSAEVDPAAVAAEACRRALEARGPAELPAGAYTVVFEAEAVRDLLWYLAYLGFNGMAVAEKRSPLWDKLGERVFGENIGIAEEPGHPGLFGIDFDGEGVDTQRVKLVENGVLRSFLHDRLSAQLTGQEPTGHGLPAPNAWGPFPFFPVLAGGERSLDELVASVDRGVLVTRLWYTNVVDPMRMIITGMTRDGTFLIEKGRRQGPVKNFRFNQSLLELFNRVEELGKVEAMGDMALPSMVVRDFRFSSGTDF